jgi:hypothetical protein
MDSNQLDAKIKEFEARVGGTLTPAQDGQFWRETWAIVKEIDSEFKTVSYATEADKKAALQRFQNIVDQVRADRKRAELKRTSQAKGSNVLRARIINLACAAWPGGDDFALRVKELTGLTLPDQASPMSQEKAKTVPKMLNANAREREKHRLAELSGRMKEALAVFNERKEDLLPKAQGDCAKILEAVQAGLNRELDAWQTETLARTQQRAATFEQKREEKLRLIAEMKALIASVAEKGFKDRSEALMAEWKKVGSAGMDFEDDLWAKFKSALNEFWLVRKGRRNQILQDRLNNQVEFLAKMQQSIAHDKGVLQEKREKLANVFDGARADEIRTQLGTVIESLEQKIKSKWIKVKELQTEITEIRRNLRDAE